MISVKIINKRTVEKRLIKVRSGSSKRPSWRPSYCFPDWPSKPKEYTCLWHRKQTLGTAPGVTPAICHKIKQRNSSHELSFKTLKWRPYCCTKQTVAMLAYQANSGIGIFFACGIENRGFGIRTIAQGIRNPTIDWNPESSWTLSSCRNFLLFHEKYIAVGHVNEKERFPSNSEMRPLATESLVKPQWN